MCIRDSLEIIRLDFEFENKDQARQVMFYITDLFRNWNYAPMDSDEFKKILAEIDEIIATKGKSVKEALVK